MFCDSLKTHYTMSRVLDLVNIIFGRASELLHSQACALPCLDSARGNHSTGITYRIHIPLDAMQHFASRLFWAIFISSCICAYGQKCDLVLYSAPCGAASYLTLSSWDCLPLSLRFARNAESMYMPR